METVFVESRIHPSRRHFITRFPLKVTPNVSDEFVLNEVNIVCIMHMYSPIHNSTISLEDVFSMKQMLGWRVG